MSKDEGLERLHSPIGTMKIKMIGIDHCSAAVEVRERYAFTNAGARTVLQTLKNKKGIVGGVLLSTCNRTELYVSLTPDAQADLYGWLCEWKGLTPSADRTLFYEKNDLEAAHHVFELACGLCSQIVGEDQILTQVKDALALAREEYAADHCLEILFRQAVTVAKEIKSSIVFEKGNRSAAETSIMQLQNSGAVFAGKQALVIGNGMMGKLTAQALMEAQAQVTVTVRQYRSGIVDIPAGAERINYGERYEKIKDVDYIFSATASPNLTITAEGLSGMELRGKVFVDLAVPRDIDPAVGHLSGVRLLGMDDLSVEQLSPEQKEQQKQARENIAEALAEFERYFYGRDLIPRIGAYAKASAEDLWGRMHKDCAALAEKEHQIVEAAAKRSGEKVVAHVLYALRDRLDADTFARCMNILEEDLL